MVEMVEEQPNLPRLLNIFRIQVISTVIQPITQCELGAQAVHSAPGVFQSPWSLHGAPMKASSLHEGSCVVGVVWRASCMGFCVCWCVCVVVNALLGVCACVHACVGVLAPQFRKSGPCSTWATSPEHLQWALS